MGRELASEILQRIKSNDRQYLAELTTYIQTLAAKMSLPRHISPEDIAQEVFQKVIEALQGNKFRGDSSLRTYIHKVTVYTCLNYYRDCRRAEWIDIDLVQLIDPAEDPETSCLTKEQWTIAAKVIAVLPSKCKRLWRLMFWDDKEYNEVAALMDVKVGRVREQMFECRRRARELAAKFEKPNDRPPNVTNL